MVKRTDDETRNAIARLAAEIEDEGFEVNRRAMAREFGVSPQTVARILDGPNARRKATQSEGSQHYAALTLIGAGAVAVLAWIVYRRPD